MPDHPCSVGVLLRLMRGEQLLWPVTKVLFAPNSRSLAPFRLPDQIVVDFLDRFPHQTCYQDFYSESLGGPRLFAVDLASPGAGLFLTNR